MNIEQIKQKGYNIPLLMPFQHDPFNGDKEIEIQTQRLIFQYNIKKAIETGTCLGATTKFLSKQVSELHTIEINESFLNIAKMFCDSQENIIYHLGNSAEILKDVLSKVENNTFIFLDAHWNEFCPLKDELKQIAESKLKPVIAIHDFFVPDTDLGYDEWNGQAFTFEWLKTDFDNIYGKDNYEYHYNNLVDEYSVLHSIGARRGVLFVYPNID